MNVLLIPSFYPSPSSPLCGIFFQDQARALASVDGIEVTVAVLEGRSLRELRLHALRASHFQQEARSVDGVQVIARKGWNPMVATIGGGRLFAALLRQHVVSVIASRDAPDIVHAHNGLWGGYAVRSIGRQYGIPVVLTEHDSQFLECEGGRRWDYARVAWQSADALVAVSAALARNVAQHSGREVRVIPNIVDTTFFTPGPREPSDRFVFLAVANLVPVKGLDVLIPAFVDAFRNDPTTVLRIAGDGSERDVLQALTVACGAADRITFLGRLNREAVRDEMRRADACVVASRRETFGIAAAEAMACGLPVVATKSGGPDDVVVTGAGVLVPPDDRAALAAALARMRHEAGAYDPTAIHESVTQRYSESVVTQQIVDVYRSVVAGKAVRA